MNGSRLILPPLETPPEVSNLEIKLQHATADVRKISSYLSSLQPWGSAIVTKVDAVSNLVQEMNTRQDKINDAQSTTNDMQHEFNKLNTSDTKRIEDKLKNMEVALKTRLDEMEKAMDAQVAKIIESTDLRLAEMQNKIDELKQELSKATSGDRPTPEPTLPDEKFTRSDIIAMVREEHMKIMAEAAVQIPGTTNKNAESSDTLDFPKSDGPMNIELFEDWFDEGQATEEVLDQSGPTENEVIEDDPPTAPATDRPKKKKGKRKRKDADETRQKKKSKHTDDSGDKARKRTTYPDPECRFMSSPQSDIKSIVECLKESEKIQMLVAPGTQKKGYFPVYAEQVCGYITLDGEIDIESTWLDVLRIMDGSDEGKQILEAAGKFGVGSKIQTTAVHKTYRTKGGLYKSIQNREDDNKNILHYISLGSAETYTVILFDTSKQYGMATETYGDTLTYAWVMQRQTAVYEDAISTVMYDNTVPASFNKEYKIVTEMENMNYNVRHFIFHLVAYLYDLSSPVTYNCVKRTHKKPTLEYDSQKMQSTYENSSISLGDMYNSIVKNEDKPVIKAFRKVYESSVTQDTDIIRHFNSETFTILNKYVGGFK